VLYYGLLIGIIAGVIHGFVFMYLNHYTPLNYEKAVFYIIRYSINHAFFITVGIFAVIALMSALFNNINRLVILVSSFFILFTTVGFYLNRKVLPHRYDMESIVGNVILFIVCIVPAFWIYRRFKPKFNFVKSCYNKKILVGLLLVFVAVNGVSFTKLYHDHFVSISKEISDEQVIRLFNLDYPGLEKTKRYTEDGDFHSAMVELLDYFASREEESWLFRKSQLVLFDSSYVIEKAEKAIEQKFSNVGIIASIPDKIDWVTGPVNNKEWIYRLNTHWWWWRLAVAYQLTGDERYTIAFVDQMADWITANPVIRWKNESLPTWRLLEAGCRMVESWILSFQLFSGSQFFTIQKKKMMLASIYNHAQFLKLFKSPKRNHLLFESLGLAYVSIFFPEYKHIEEWREIALERIEHMIDTEINDDGSYVELSVFYQMEVAGLFDQLKDLSNIAGEKFLDNQHKKRIESLFEFLLKLSKPDGTLPAINDGDPRNLKEMLTYAGDRYQRADFKFVANGFEQGERPEYLSCSLPDAGMYVMRSDWTTDALYMIVDAGPYGSGHGHEDKLSFELHAYGKTFLVDPGTYTKNEKDPYRYYFMRSSAHNTITVDEKSQLRYWNKKNWNYHKSYPNDNVWFSDDQYDFLVGRYDEGYGHYKEKLDKSITHVRKVLFVKPEYWVIADYLLGKGEHSFQQYFHFAPMKVINKNKMVYTVDPTGPNLAIVPLIDEEVQLQIVEGSEDPIQGWVSEEFNQKIAAPVAIYSKETTAPTKFFTIIYLAHGDIEPQNLKLEVIPVVIDDEDKNGYFTNCVKLTTAGWADYILISESNAGKKSFDQFVVNSNVAYYRKDKQGNVVKQFEIFLGDGEKEK
ncbi:MAG TPA: hypothetical protein ENN22_05295, partial [bacterium]|nr:hypothetical protein [bacterium]